MPVEVSLSVPKTADGVGVGLQDLRDRLGLDPPAPLGREDHRLDPEGPAEDAPPRREPAGVEDDRLAASGDGVDHRRFHRPGPRGGQDQDVVPGPEDIPEPRDDLLVPGLRLGRSVVDHRARQLDQDVFRDRGRSRRHQARLPHRRRTPSRTAPGGRPPSWKGQSNQRSSIRGAPSAESRCEPWTCHGFRSKCSRVALGAILINPIGRAVRKDLVDARDSVRRRPGEPAR